jgi:nucleoside-diphosphate-sugar epimerase
VKVFLTGATGFVGKHLAASLIADGAQVRALVHPSSDPAAVRKLGVEAISGDVRDIAAVRYALADCGMIYHLAGLVPGKGRTRADYHAVNVQGTENVVRAAVEAGVQHLVHCSTVAVHGLPHRTPADEEAPLTPENVYGATKLKGERVVLRFVREHGLSAIITRLTPLYGRGDFRCLKLFRDVASGRIVVIGSGRFRYHLTYIDDAVAGLRLCGARGGSGGERFIIGGEELPTLNELLRMIADATGVDLRMIRLPAAPFALAAAVYRRLLGPFGIMPGLVDRLDFFTAERTYDVSKAKRELGFQSQVPLREGIGRTAAWYREKGHL